jgi:hydroxyacylglutathione hydrolase
MYVRQYFIEGLGCASYLVGCEAEGVAAVIDPDREVQKYLDGAAARGLKITHIIETHLHADHISGNADLAALTGASIYLHEESGASFAHQKVKDGDVLELGNLRLAVRHTPGHTPESVTLLVTDTTRSQDPWLALTGDTLFVGDAGRPDLVGLDAARGLSGKMFNSLFNTILPMEDGLLIFPGHGSGSLCGKSIGSMRSSTLGYERKSNPALVDRSVEEFVEYATSNLPEQPGNHTRIKAINRRGPAQVKGKLPQPLTVRESIPHFQRGAGMLDTRSHAAYVEKHVPGSVHLEADDQLSNRVGFVLPPDLPFVLVLDKPEDLEQVFYSLARVGYDEKIVGYLSEDLQAWEALGLPVTSGDIEDINAQELNNLLVNGNGSAPVVVDVRETWEYRQGHIPGAVSMPLGELSRRAQELDPEKPVAIICATGNRSQSGAAFFGQQNFKKIYNVTGGTMGWMRHGLPLEK